MPISYKNGDKVSDCIGLLISILMRYPEVGSIHFDPQNHTIRLTFILSGDNGLSQAEAGENFIAAVRIYHQLEKITPHVFSWEEHFSDGYTMIDLKRDVDTLSKNEIAFLMDLCRLHFDQVLVVDGSDELWEEDIEIQEEMIGHMLEGMKKGCADKKLLAYREEGKVLVFNH